MHATNGDDVNYNGLSWSRPFQSITHALSVVSSGDTILVGSGQYDPTIETFPLGDTNPLPPTDLTISGSGTPVISAYSGSVGNYVNANFTGSSYSGDLAPCLVARHGWVIEGLTFLNDHYDKTTGGAYGHVAGIHVPALQHPSSGSTGTLRIERCTFDDDFVGIFLDDSSDASVANETRVVDIVDCTTKNHEPVILDPGRPNDLGHQGILTNNYRSMTINISGCTFENDHDGLESANGLPDDAEVIVTDCYFKACENGLEMADGLIEVVDTTFEKCQSFDPFSGGVGSSSSPFATTVAIALRGSANHPNGSELTVRGCFFDRCQTAVYAIAPFDVVDLGTSLSGADRGNNTFTMDTSSPWDPTNPLYTISHVAVCTVIETQVDAVGNTWTYDATWSLALGYNQGVDSNGSYDQLVAQSLPPGMPIAFVFEDDNGINIQAQVTPPGFDRPWFRHTQSTWTSGAPNRPWNFATGHKTGTVAPSLRVK